MATKNIKIQAAKLSHYSKNVDSINKGGGNGSGIELGDIETKGGKKRSNISKQGGKKPKGKC